MRRLITVVKMGITCLLVASTMMTGLGVGTASAAVTPGDGGGGSSSGITPGSAQDNVCKGIGLTTSNGKCGDNGDQVRSAIAAAINILSLAVGIAAVVMIIVAGFKFITAGGEASKIASAKGSIVYAIIGIIVVALAQFIVRFVLTQVKP